MQRIGRYAEWGYTMNHTKIENQAFKAACEAKPGILKHNGRIYTLVFSQKEWVYEVFEDGFLMLRYNTKKITQAKKWLKDYLDN